MYEKTHKYILDNWETTVRHPKSKKDITLSILLLPNTYTSPCAGDAFDNFYYWDTYFTNLGLLEDDRIDLARNNLKIMKFFVNRLGFVPNAGHLNFATQPPLFTRGVFDLYKKSKDKNDILLFIDEIKKELDYWSKQRITPIGLNQYKSGCTDEQYIRDYDYWINRVGGLRENEKNLTKIEVSKHFFGIGESGWDLDYRFLTDEFRFASQWFVEIDLNSILYDAEISVSKMLKDIGRDDESSEYLKKANARKQLIHKYMFNKNLNIYQDYEFVHNKSPKHITASSFVPYALGIDNNKEALKLLLSKLEFEYGLSADEYHDENVQFLNWDYPQMWPSNVYFAYIALKNAGMNEDANRIKTKYMESVERNLEISGKLWEKYDVSNGKVGEVSEYKTPTMLGWTAGVFEFLLNN